ncbi:MAG: hypothetical protein QME52_02640 [Bacteroidota bacterium]|nr:hypothetical protein [Bacteroidota bacterium]
MKNICLVLIMLLLLSAVSLAQFKSQAEKPSVAQSMVQPGASMNSFFGLLNPNNFMMRHNFSMSYMSFGGNGLSLASYTNSIFYKISDPLNVRFDVTLQGSPFGQSNYQNSFSGLYLSRAQLNYKPWENFLIKFEYNQLPRSFYGTYNPWYNPYSPFRNDD